MKAKKVILSVLLVGVSASLFAQQVQRDADFNIINFKDAIFSKDVTQFRIDNPELKQRSDSVSYDKINGSPFWVDVPQSAHLYNSKGYLGTLPVRINLATNKIYFLKDGEEMILNDNIVTRIVFNTANDSSVFIGQVPDLLVNNKPFNKFVQVLNTGKYQLLKYTTRIVTSEETPSHTSRTYQYKNTYRYFMQSEERVGDVKKLSSENILIYLPVSSSYNNWIKENKINFKNEKDIIRFLNHYNSNIKN